MRWSPMTSTIDLPVHSTLGLPSHNYASSASSSNAAGTTPTSLRKTTSGQIKKRASRAGTRSVNTLSVAQLERKRANDREAQRAIRQRTKDHIDSLEATLNDVKQTLANREKLLAASYQRTRELEEENAVLRMRLSDANVPTGLPQEYQRAPDPHTMSAPPSAVSEASGSLSQRSSAHAVNFSMPTANAGWTPQGNIAPSNTSLVLATESDASRNVTGWRARDSPATTSVVIPPGLHPPQALPFTPITDRTSWSSVSQQYEYGQNNQSTTHFQQPQSEHFPTPTSAYPNTPQQAQAPLHPPHATPQHDFHHFYQYQQDGFPPQQYQTNASQSVQPSYQASQAVQSTHRSSAEQVFTQSFHPPMQLPQEAAYNMAHFPQG